MRRAAPILLVLTVLWAVDAAFGWGIFWGHDLRHHHYPWRAWAAAEWLAGRVPLWAPGVANGFPLMADGQAGVFYPPTMLLFALLPGPLALNWSLLLHFWWAALGMFALLRGLGRQEGAALFGGVAFGFSGFLATHALYLGMLSALAWLPWVLWATWTRRHGISGLCAWMMLVAGHPQAAAFGLLLAGAFALFAAGEQRRLPLGFAGAMALALLAASPQLVATLELARFASMREGGVSALFANIGGLPPQELINGVLPWFFGYDRPGDVAQSYYHRGDGYWGAGENHWEMAFYLGIPSVLLATAPAWAALRALADRARGQPLSPRDRQRIFWVIVAFGSVLLMLGGRTPAWPLLRQLPGLDGFRFPARFAALLTLAAAALAADGLERLLLAAPPERARWARAVCAAAAAFGVGMGAANLALRVGEGSARLALARRFLSEPAPPPPPADLSPLARAALPSPEPEKLHAIPTKIDRIILSLHESTSPLSPRVYWPLLVALLVATAVAAAGRGRWQPARVSALLTGLLFADLYRFGGNYQVRYDPEEVGALPSALPFLQSEPGRYRATTVDRRQDPRLDVELINASLGLLHGTRDVILTSPLLMVRNDALLALAGLDVGDRGRQKVSRLLDHPHLVDLLGLRWLLTVHEIDDPGYERLMSAPVNLYRNADPLPGAFLVGCAHQADEAGLWPAMAELDPRRWAVVEEGVSVPPCRDGADAGLAEIVEEDPQRIVVRVEAARTALLVQNDSFYPGWEARLDGTPVKLLRADLLFRGVEVPPGEHVVELVYRPPAVRAGLAAMPLALLALLFWAAAAGRPAGRRA